MSNNPAHFHSAGEEKSDIRRKKSQPSETKSSPAVRCPLFLFVRRRTKSQPAHYFLSAGWLFVRRLDFRLIYLSPSGFSPQSPTLKFNASSIFAQNLSEDISEFRVASRLPCPCGPACVLCWWTNCKKMEIEGAPAPSPNYKQKRSEGKGGRS